MNRGSRRSWTVLLAMGVLVLGIAATASFGAEPGQYLGPVDLVASPNGDTLYVLEADAKKIDVVEVGGGKVTRSLPCPDQPNGLARSPDGAKLYVACGAVKGVVAVIEAATGKVQTTIPVGHSPCGPSVTPDGNKLIVCNRFHHDVSIIDVAAGKEVAKVKVVREPWASAVTPDGKIALVSNLLPIDRSDSYDVASHVTLIDLASNQATNVRLPNGSSSVHRVCVSPDGKYAYVVHILSRYQMPTTQLERGWMNTNAMTVIDVAAKKPVNSVLLDNVDLGAANPWGVTVTADGKTIVVSHAGTHELSVIDTKGLMDKLASIPKTVEEAKKAGRYDGRGTYSSITADDVPNDLAFLVDIRRRIYLRRGGPYGTLNDEGPMIKGPRGLVVLGTKVYVAAYFSDLLAVVDLEDKSYFPVKAIRLGPEPQFTVQRRGQLFFQDADLCFQHWQSCESCHPDARMDGLNWDLMNDGLGNPKNTKSMLLAHKTPPAMSMGVREKAEDAVRSGIRHIQFAVRPEEDAVAIDEYLKSLQPVPSPHLVNGGLSEAAKRGKELFFSERVGCAKCHPEQTLYTDMKHHNVNSKGQFDRNHDFDTPALIESWRTAPYLHDGSAIDMQELLGKGKHGRHGPKDAQLTEQELKDLCEFVLSL